MDVKDLRTESALSERNNDGSKYSQGGVALACNRNKLYQDIGSNTLAKTEPAAVRPCAVIGPDRVVPPPASNDAFLKKGTVEPWPGPDNLYRRTHEYPLKLISGNQNPSRNISPRQTFQEHMQRITVQPTYSAVRHSDDVNFSHVQDRNLTLPKNIKPNVPSEAKYCDMPYGINTPKEPKNVRDNELYMQSVNSVLTRTAPHGWPPAGVSVHAPRSYNAHELYQYPYPSCAGQRPAVIPLARPHRTLTEDPAYAYSEHYQDASAHYKGFPTMKDRYPQGRYDYISNYPSQFHPPSIVPSQKYDIPKPGQSHPYPVYPQLKYLDNRAPEHNIEGFQRPNNQQPHYNVQYRNQVIHPPYAPVHGNSSQNKLHPYPPDGATKSVASNKLPYDSNSKMFIDYENSRTKAYPLADNYFVNEMGRVHPVKNQMGIPNYSPIGMHAIPSQHYYRKEISKPFDFIPHFRHFDPAMNHNPMMRHAPQFSPNTLAISPSDSSTSNDNSQSHGISQEDCGYVSQSSTASMRSIDSGVYRLPHEYYKRYDYRYGRNLQSSPTLSKSENPNNSNSKDKQKDINVRQFLQMWNDDGVEDENSVNNNSKDIVIRTGSSETSNFAKQHNNQDELYVLGLVNVPNEELSKYEHIQKISKLPENIKGYNTLELLSQFEEAIESSNTSNFKSISKDYQMASKVNSPKQVVDMLPRPVSPLDVEAKISQSVIHKEVGCNFEIRPCSPKMLNVEVAAPAQNILGELMIEKVKNPLSNVVKSPKPIKHDENSNCHTIRIKENSFALSDNPSCKMIRSPFASNNMDSVKTNYSLQDLEINSGVCLASLPRLDNEIELHFPEVNQQFINANKKEDNASSKCNTPNNLEEEFRFSDSKSIKKDMDEKFETAVLGDDCEKIYTKLSKYRKFKTNVADNSEKCHPTQVIRTDSVIIKNPENLKNIEDKLLENSLTPINLSSQSSMSHDLPTNICENSHKDFDVALDFSLNKSTIDLPIINTEKDELTSSLNSNISHMPYNNISGMNSIDTCIKKINVDENDKTTNTKCKIIESDECNIMNNDDQCVQNKRIKNSDYINVPVFKSKDTITMDFDNSCDRVLISGNSPLGSPNVDVRNETHGTNFSDVEELQLKNEQYGTCKNTILLNNDKKSNDHDPAPTFISDQYMETDSAFNQSVMQESNLQNEVKKTDDVNVANVNEFTTSSHIQNDFENDEITASLEKLFRDSDDDLTQMDCGESMSKPIALPMKVFSFHQNKELYSPWIQKLLTHSEGSCSRNDRESKQRNSLKSILNDDEDNIEEIHYDNLKVEHSRDMDVDDEFKRTILPHTSTNEHFIKDTIEKSSSEALCPTGLESYKTLLLLNDNITKSFENVNVCVNKKENKAQAKIKALPDKETTSKTAMEIDDISSTNIELHAKSNQSSQENEPKLLQDSKSEPPAIQHNLDFHIKTSQINFKESEVLQISESEPNILISNTALDLHVKMTEKEHETSHEKNLELTCDNVLAVCKADSMIHTSDIVSNNSIEIQINSDQGADFRQDNVNTIYTNDGIEKQDISGVIKKRDNGDEDRLVATCLEQELNDASDNCIGQHNETENVAVKNIGSKSSENVDSNKVSKCENMIQDMFNEVKLEDNLKDVTETFSQDKMEVNKTEKGSFERHDILNTGDTSSTFDKGTVEELVNIYQKEGPPQTAPTVDSGQSHKNQNLESLAKSFIPLPVSDTCTIDNCSKTDILPLEINKIEQQSSSSFDSNHCTTFQTVEIQSEDIFVKSDSKLDIIQKEEKNRSKGSPSIDLCASSNSVSNTEIIPETSQNKEKYVENENALNASCNNVISSLAGAADSLIKQNKSFGRTPDSVSEQNKYDIDSLNETRTDTVGSPARPTVGPAEHNDINSSMNNTSECKKPDSRSEYQIPKDVTSSLHESSDTEVVVSAAMPNYPMEEYENNCDMENAASDCASDTQTDHPNMINELLQEIDAAALPISACNSPIQDGTKSVAIDIVSNCIFDDKAQSIESCVTDAVNISNKVVENDKILMENNSIKLDTQEISIQNSPMKRRLLKRSNSDSALNSLKHRDGSDRQVTENTPFIWPSKRQRMYEIEHSEQHVIGESLCNLIQNNRRNSVSAFCNEQNVSFCILIDNNCILTEENEEDKICFAEVSDECIAEIDSANEDIENEVMCCSQDNELDVSEAIVLNYENEKSIQESWLDNVACVETVVSDDIEDEDVIGDHYSPGDIEISEFDESGIYSCDLSEHPDEVNFLNDENVCDIVAQNVEICRSPSGQMEEFKLTTDENSVGSDSQKINGSTNIHCDLGDDNEIQIADDNEIQIADEISSQLCDHISESGSLENIVSETTTSTDSSLSLRYTFLPETTNKNMPENKENVFKESIASKDYESDTEEIRADNGIEKNKFCEDVAKTKTSCHAIIEDNVHSCETSKGDIFSYNKPQIDDMCYSTSSSPEVSSTTFEEKSSSILLKITNFNGSRVSEINEVKHNKPRCKFTEKKEYSNSYGIFPKRPLLTKAAQKYIPPLKETICDLKVKLTLPQQRLLKLKQLKMSRSELKQTSNNNNNINVPTKKPKPNFEDVLKSIDEVQIKNLKEKNKKPKNVIPKVVIKKNLNGSHYTSSSNKDNYNPDLTGRKWQPWVFLEKNHFIDQMAVRNKTKAIYNHRNKKYVLAEKFKKYKSASNCSAKFVISQPKTSDSSKGQLKYTIRLKHIY